MLGSRHSSGVLSSRAPERLADAASYRDLAIVSRAEAVMYMAEAEILNAYPDLEVEDIREALRYAAEVLRERELPVVGGSCSSW